MITRRCFIKSDAVAGGFALLPKWPFPSRALAHTGEVTLDPESIPKYPPPLVIPPAMLHTTRREVHRLLRDRGVAAPQQILPPGRLVLTPAGLFPIHPIQ
jgi:hypothetical protein